MTAIFVTATGTDIGKTFVTAGLVRFLREQQRPVEALKPVVSGFDPSKPDDSDPAMLLSALGRPLKDSEIEKLSPWRYRAALAPDLAAAREGKTLDFDALLKFCRDAVIASSNRTLLIEGVGGIMAPLDQRRTMIDWMAALRQPLLLVTGSYLGTISHTLTALDVLAHHKLKVSAIVVSESEGSSVSLDDTAGSISRFANGVAVVGLPRLPAGLTQHPAFAQIAERLKA